MDELTYRDDQIDWQDGLNPLAIPAFARHVNRYVYEALENPIMRELRYQPGYETHLYAAPDDTVPTLPALQTVDSLITLPAGAWLFGVSVASPNAAGILVQITLPEGTNIFSVPTSSKSLKNAIPHFFARPAGFPARAAVKVSMKNQANANNTAQVVLWVIQPL